MSAADDEPPPEAGKLPTGRLARTARVGGLVTGQGLRWAGMRTANRVRGPERAGFGGLRDRRRGRLVRLGLGLGQRPYDHGHGPPSGVGQFVLYPAGVLIRQPEAERELQPAAGPRVAFDPGHAQSARRQMTWPAGTVSSDN